ncbi:MAG: geranylgeranyl bacteriochlorophyll reductase-like protein [Gammaproteobacteria bacterium]|nr:MAG: geranylgeranyl bacteriochlorophyll reductase-like protein [Gammaproteobacteria bacterium]
MERCDALIVGGGPAGSTLARALSRAGRDVVIIDRARFPRDKTCAGWITPAVAEALALDAADYRAGGRVWQPIDAFAVGLEGERPCRVDYPEPVSYGIRRCEFDHYLLARCGARLEHGVGLERLERRGETWIVNDRWQTPLVVGAGGHFCPVARALGAVAERETVVAAKEVEFELDAAQAAACPVDGACPELYFCRDLKGYGWVFRKGPVLNIGLGREDPRGLGPRLDAFCRALAAADRIPAALPRFKGHAYLLWGHQRRPPVHDGALLIGDAAGLAYPQSGEGIRPAVESALLAARVLLAADGRYTRERLAPYERALAERFGPPRGPAPAWLGVLRRPLARLLLTRPAFVRRVVLDRWFLHRDQAPLAAA